MKSFEIIEKIADNELKNIKEKGFSKAGVNGPYNCEDTPIRNCAHWICIYKYLYNKTGEKCYYEIITLLADYICSEEYNSKSGAIKCMSADKMDSLNGSIGQAWTIEGLIAAYEIIKDEKYYEKAVQIFLSQKYDFDKHLWDRIDLDSTNLGIDTVFNHELWLAASGFIIINAKNNEEIRKQVDDFMTNIDLLYDVYDSGLFKHYINGYSHNQNILKKIVKKSLHFLKVFNPKFDECSFEKGYHLFDLYGFALIYNIDNSYEIFKSEKFNKAVQYGLNIDKLNKEFNVLKYLNSKLPIFKYNKYSYSYNSPAFEYPLVDYTFNNGKNREKYESLFKIQYDFSYNKETMLFEKNTNDGVTLTARLYELAKYLELEEMK